MVAGAPVSLGEFLALPETEPASEYLCGEVVQKPMLDLPHSLVQSFLLTALSAFVRRARPGVCGAELRCVFGPPGQERAYLPDVCFISWSRLGRGDARAADGWRRRSSSTFGMACGWSGSWTRTPRP
jgi:Uma2 family endonuclease